MRLELDFQKKKDIPVSEIWVKNILRELLHHYPKRTVTPQGNRISEKTAYHISVAFVSDTVMRRLNRDYRGKDKTTDVLAIEGHDGLFVEPEQESVDLGEIIISYAQACRQAKQFGLTERQELTKLLIHGFYHILGYDHEKDEDARVMEPMEKKSMKIFYPRLKREEEKSDHAR